MAAKLLTELPAVPVSAWRIRSLASEDKSRPTDQLIDSDELIGSGSNPLVPYTARIPDQFPPPEIPLANESSGIKSKGANGRCKPTRYRPDAFISIRISSPVIISQLSAIQSELSQLDPSFARTIISPSGFHLTLLTLYTADTADNINTAGKLINTAIENYRGNITDVLDLSFRGLGQFSRKVLFSPLLQNKHFHNLSGLADSISNLFSQDYKSPFDEIIEFTPHLTLAKTSRTLNGPYRHRLYEFKCPDLINKIVSKYYNCLFGTQTVDSIELLSINKPKTADGYYHCYHTFKL